MNRPTRFEYRSEGGEYSKTYMALANTTHLLIAGTTGSGKSTVINNLLGTVIRHSTPADLNYMIIDPKRIDLIEFKDVSRFCLGYATETADAEAMLDRAISIMEYRYSAMAQQRIKMWNGPRLLVIVDELADLTDGKLGKRVQDKLKRLLRLGRAAKISVWAATQSPSRKVIPAELVQNFTDRLALRCLSPIESRQIIGCDGAEMLPKHGVGIWYSSNGIKKYELTYCGEQWVRDRINYWKANPGWEITTNWIGREIKKPICA